MDPDADNNGSSGSNNRRRCYDNNDRLAPREVALPNSSRRKLGASRKNEDDSSRDILAMSGTSRGDRHSDNRDRDGRCYTSSSNKGTPSSSSRGYQLRLLLLLAGVQFIILNGLFFHYMRSETLVHPIIRDQPLLEDQQLNITQHEEFATSKQRQYYHKDVHLFLSEISSTKDNGASNILSNNNNNVTYYTCNNKALRYFPNQIRKQQTRSRMPHIIHVNSKTKCVTQQIGDYILQWRMPHYSLYLHDDEEMNNLFVMDTVKDLFPTLYNSTYCLPYQGIDSSASKNDLFRFLLYYFVGGIYTEYDLYPNLQFSNAVELFESYLEEDGNVELDGAAMFLKNDQNKMPFLGTIFSTPNHPLFYICVDLTIRNLLRLKNVANQRAFGVTGPPIMHEALQIFAGVTQEKDKQWKSGVYTMSRKALERYPYLATRYEGKNYTIFIPEHDNYYDYVYTVNGEMLKQKQIYYKLAGLVHWQSNDKGVHVSNSSCVEYLKQATYDDNRFLKPKRGPRIDYEQQQLRAAYEKQ